MKIIKNVFEDYKSSLVFPVRITCPKCGSILEVELIDCQFTLISLSEFKKVILCPCCNCSTTF